MKNIMLKIIFIFGILIYFSQFSHASVIGPNIKVKIDGADDSTYTTSLSDVSNASTTINLEIVGVYTSTSTGSYSISLPSGFQYVSDSDSGTTCDNQNVTLRTDTGFSYTVSPTNQTCISRFVLTYIVTGVTVEQTHQISVFDAINFSNASSLDLGVTSANTLQTAETVDSDGDGYIDQYKLTFATGGLSGFSNTDLTVGTLGGITLSSTSDNIAYISFDDTTYKTGETPDLVDLSGLIFTGIGIIESATITEQEKASPVVLSVSSNDVNGASSPSINIASQSERLEIQMSENLTTSTVTSNFVIKEDGIDITNLSYITFNETNGDTIYYCMGGHSGTTCNTSFDSEKTYTVELPTSITDLNSNANTDNTLTITFGDSTSPTGSSITYNSETNTAIVIQGNSGSNGYTNTSDGSINFSILATDNSGVVSEMCISESVITNDSSCTSWESYSTSKSFTFTGVEGTQTIYIKFKDATGNVSSVYTDTINWDKTTPSSSNLPSAGEFGNGSVSVTLNCTDSNAGCDVIYYTTDGTTPTTSSSSVTSGNTVSVSGTNETKTLKFFAQDLANNSESSINSVDYVFSDTYATISTSTTLTTSTAITLTGTCNNASGNNEVEYSLNSGSYTAVTSDSCESSNTWSSDITLSSNTSNTIELRLINNTNVSSSTTITHDDTAPTGSILIDSGASSTTSTSVSLTISATDSVGVDTMCISESSLSSDDTCGNTWETYASSDTFTMASTTGTKTIYIKFKDTAGNISSVYSDTITLESTSSGGGGGGGGGGSSSSAKKYENYSNITKKRTKLTTTASEDIDNYSILDISKLTTKKLTNNATIKIKSHLKSKSYLTIFPDTKINEEVEAIYPPHYYELIRDLKVRSILVNGSEFRASNVKRFFHVGDEENSISFNKDIGLELNLGAEMNSMYVYFSEKADGNFTLLKSNLKTDEEGVISFKTNQLGYFAVIRARYLGVSSFDVYKRIEEGSDSEDTYVQKVEENGVTIYKTQYSKLSEKVAIVEKVILGKFKKLLDQGKIPEVTYTSAVNNYNDFILHLSIYKMTKQKAAVSKAITSAKKFIKIYKIK